MKNGFAFVEIDSGSAEEAVQELNGAGNTC